MFDFLNIILATAILNHVVLIQGVGASSWFAYSSRFIQSVEVAIFTLPVFIAASVINVLLQRSLLGPLDLKYLALPAFMLSTGSLAVLLAHWVGLKLPLTARRNRPGFYLVGANSAIIGLSILPNLRDLPLIESLATIFGAAIGFSLTLIAFAALRERLQAVNAPRAMRGAPLALLSAGILAMSLIGLQGAG